MLKAHDIQISMDGKGCWRDNVFVERLWKTIKYEEIYLHAYEQERSESLGPIINSYKRADHTQSDGHTPDSVYFSSRHKAGGLTRRAITLKNSQLAAAGHLFFQLQSASEEN